MRFGRVLGLGIGIGLALVVGPAMAQDAPSPDGGEEGYYYTEYERRWYGWQTLAVDVPLLTVFAVAQSAGEDGVAIGSFAGFVVGAPVVHLANRRSTPAVVSGFGHLLMPTLTWALVPSAIKAVDEDVSGDTKTAVAVTMGGAMAAAFDAIWVAWDETEQVVDYDNASGGSWVPQVGFTGRAGWIGVGGRF